MFELHHIKLCMYNLKLWSVLYFPYISELSTICFGKFQCYIYIYTYTHIYIYGVCLVDSVALILLWTLPASCTGNNRDIWPTLPNSLCGPMQWYYYGQIQCYSVHTGSVSVKHDSISQGQRELIWKEWLIWLSIYGSYRQILLEWISHRYQTQYRVVSNITCYFIQHCSY